MSYREAHTIQSLRRWSLTARLWMLVLAFTIALALHLVGVGPFGQPVVAP